MGVAMRSRARTNHFFKAPTTWLQGRMAKCCLSSADACGELCMYGLLHTCTDYIHTFLFLHSSSIPCAGGSWMCFPVRRACFVSAPCMPLSRQVSSVHSRATSCGDASHLSHQRALHNTMPQLIRSNHLHNNHCEVISDVRPYQPWRMSFRQFRSRHCQATTLCIDRVGRGSGHIIWSKLRRSVKQPESVS